MFWSIRQLMAPASYLRIRHGGPILQSKVVFDWILPSILTITLILLLWLLDIPLVVSASGKLLARINDLLVLLIAFYMAALAAVSTFDRPGLDDTIVNDKALLWGYDKKIEGFVFQELTYREFISYLFGYLAFLSLTIYIFIMAFDLTWTKIEGCIPFIEIGGITLLQTINAIILFVLLLAISQLFITSLLGIHFLTERIQALTKK